MASTTAKGSGSTKNNGATVIGGGNFDSTGPITNSLAVKDLSKDAGYGSRIIESLATDNDYTSPNGLTVANSGTAGGLAFTPDPRKGERNVIARGVGSTSGGKINNSTSSVLDTLGSEYAGIPRGKENTHTGTRALGARQWTYPVLPDSGRVPGLIVDAMAGSGYDFISTSGNYPQVDKAIYGTKAVPGEVTYRTGAPTPTTSNLKPRDGLES